MVNNPQKIKKDTLVAEINKNLKRLEKEITQLTQIKDNVELDNEDNLEIDYINYVGQSERNLINRKKMYSQIKYMFDENYYPSDSEEIDSNIVANPLIGLYKFVEINENCYLISMPLLSLKATNNNDFHKDLSIKSSISAMIKSYIYEYNIKPFTNDKVVIAFVHNFDVDGMAHIVDIDNISIKKPIDAINGILIVDDNCKHVSIYQEAILTNNDLTEMYIMKESYFETWIKSRKNK